MMAMENRRVKITKLLLTDSFLHLLEQKPLMRVTVKDICEYADLNRSTYYQYYKDPYDQMEKLEMEIISEMASFVGKLEESQSKGPSQLNHIIKKTLEYIYSKREMFCILLSNHGDIHLQKDMLTFFAKELLPEDFKASRNSELLEKYIFVSNGSFGIIYYWLMSGSQESIEKLTEQITSLIEKFDI